MEDLFDPGPDAAGRISWGEKFRGKCNEDGEAVICGQRQPDPMPECAVL